MLAKILQSPAVPKEKNTLFVSPEPAKWPLLLVENKSIVENLRDRLISRTELFRLARNYTAQMLDLVCPNDRPENIIVTGHQPIWHHCGIWAKDVVACAFGKAVNGCSLHLIVDHDVCDTAMVLPRQDTDGKWDFEKVEIEPAQEAVPLELRRPSPPAHIETFVETVTNARMGHFCSDVWSKCSLLKDDRISRFDNIADVITYLQSMLHAALGLNIVYLPVSSLSQSDAFTNFALSIIQNAAAFAAGYNNAIKKRIIEEKSKPANTVRCLELDAKTGLAELPFWLLSPNGDRTSLYVVSGKRGKIGVGTASARFGALDLPLQADQFKSILRRFGCLLRPKAVSLTLFVRLFLADWFVHGVGGTRYERITDQIIEDYYGIKGLNFGVATASLTLPVPGDHDDMSETIAQYKTRMRTLMYNPEKFIEASSREKEPVRSLIARKHKLVVNAESQLIPVEARKSTWNSIRKINRRLVKFAGSSAPPLDKRIQLPAIRHQSKRVEDYREYFFGLFPEEKLRGMAESIFT